MMQLLIFSPRMAPLTHIHIYGNNTAAQVWANQGSVITASSLGPILKYIPLAVGRQHIHASSGRILG